MTTLAAATLVAAATDATESTGHTGETILFWIVAPLAVLGALGLVFSPKAVHGAMSLAVTMIGLAVLYVAQEAPFLGVVQVVVYTGAIMMLFLFVVMMLNLGRRTLEQERKWLPPAAWRWPSAMAAVLLTELIFVLMQEERAALGHIVASKEVGIRLLGPYVLAVELASMLLLAGLVGAYHLTRQEVKK